jgi:hypothetical protein
LTEYAAERIANSASGVSILAVELSLHAQGGAGTLNDGATRGGVAAHDQRTHPALGSVNSALMYHCVDNVKSHRDCAAAVTKFYRPCDSNISERRDRV